MKKVQKAGDYHIFQKRSGRYAVRDKKSRWVNAEEKAKILLEAGLIKVSAPKPQEPEEAAAATEAAEEGKAEEGTEGAEEAAS